MFAKLARSRALTYAVISLALALIRSFVGVQKSRPHLDQIRRAASSMTETPSSEKLHVNIDCNPFVRLNHLLRDRRGNEH